jgi:hypothetical protein
MTASAFLNLYRINAASKIARLAAKTDFLRVLSHAAWSASPDFHAPPLNAKFGQKVAEVAYSYSSH